VNAHLSGSLRKANPSGLAFLFVNHPMGFESYILSDKRYINLVPEPVFFVGSGARAHIFGLAHIVASG